MENTNLADAIVDQPSEQAENSLNDNEIQSTTSPHLYELASNLRSQLVLGQINEFIRKNEIQNNKNIEFKVYGYLRIVKSILVFLYAALVFLEKPFFFYQKLTWKTYTYLKNTSGNLALYGLPILNEWIYRPIELTFLSLFLIIQVILQWERKHLGYLDKKYMILQGILFAMIIMCALDIIIQLIRNAFPMLNFGLRSLVIIFLIRRLRVAWMNILLLLWRTKIAFFLLFCNMMIFALLGSFLFKTEDNSGDFDTIISAFYSLYILLTTANFPDVMLSTFKISHFCVFYFLAYIVINLFILMAVLKTLYYSSYFEIYKDESKELLDEITKKNVQSELSSDQKDKVFNQDVFHQFLLGIKRQYSFTQDEYDIILEAVGIVNDPAFNEKLKVLNEEITMMESSCLIRVIGNKWFEVAANVLDLILIFLLFYFSSKNRAIMIIQIFTCAFFIFEAFVFFYYMGIMRIIRTEMIKSLFYVFNYILFVLLISWMIFFGIDDMETCNLLYDFLKLFIALRAIRIFVLLSLFKEFEVIFVTLHNMKSLLWYHFINLLSLFFLFSTMSMMIVGGTIKKDSFFERDDIPNSYFHLNFNDYGSSFMTCVALMMINNINIMAKSLALGLSPQTFFNFYYATFYFISTLIILNICQTLLLEMYLALKSKKL